MTLYIYEVRDKEDKYHDRAFVAANNARQACYLAFREQKSKFRDYEYIDLRAKRNADLQYMIDAPSEYELKEFGPIVEARWLFDNMTYEDVLEEARQSIGW